MATAHGAGSYLAEFQGEFDRWQGRIENLRRMSAAATAPSRPEFEAGIRRISSILQATRDLLGRSEGMSPAQWMEVHPKVTAALRALQASYNTLAADWPTM